VPYQVIARNYAMPTRLREHLEIRQRVHCQLDWVRAQYSSPTSSGTLDRPPVGGSLRMSCSSTEP
jgi:hypothetical protein